MSLLRIYGSLLDPPQRCQWALVNDGRDPVIGEGPLAELPRRADRVQLLIPAAQVLIARAHLPRAAKRHAGSLLAFAVEEKTAGEPDANQVSWLAAVGDSEVLAIVDKLGLARWSDALESVGVPGYEVHCETLLLPWVSGEWSLAWNGHEGFVRTGQFEGAATDCGDREAPPLSLRLMLEEAQAQGPAPTTIVLYTTVLDAAPDNEAWSRELGIAVRLAGTWDWRTAPPGAGVSLAQQRQSWRSFADVAARLRPAAWMLGTALAIHAIALVIDWRSLANEQRALRQQMESRFRAVFPDAVAVANPVLQMRRKLVEARHAAGQFDSGDFLPMIEQVTAAAKALPVGGIRVVSYESGRMTLALSTVDQVSMRRFMTRLLQSGLSVDTSPTSARAVGAPVVLTVRAS